MSESAVNVINIERSAAVEGDRWFRTACILVLVAAAVLRFRNLNASLFEDETWVAVLVRNGGWRAHAYGTPPLFYAIERLWALLRGTSPSALREPPAFFGVVLTAIPLLANRDRLTRLFWSLLLAFSSPMLFYSTRVKQYTLEACVVAALVVLLLRGLETNRTIDWAAFYAVALLGVTTLHGTVFAVAACVPAILPRNRKIALALPLVFAAFAAAYLFYLAPGPESSVLHGDMQEFFARSGRWVSSPAMLVNDSLHFCGEMMNLVHGWWLVVVIAAVVCLRSHENRPILILSLGAVSGVAIASMFHLYPYGEVRLMIFSFPALYLVVASGLSMLVERVSMLFRAAIAAFLILFAWNAVVGDTYNSSYMKVYDLRQLYDGLARNHRQGERVFVDHTLEAPIRYHHPELGGDVVRWTDGRSHGPGWYVGDRPVTGSDFQLRWVDVWVSRVSASSGAVYAPQVKSP